MAIDGILEVLGRRIVVGDGAMGTLLYARGAFLNRAFEELNVSDPERVLDAHRGYADAGAEVLETNTFGANARKLAAFGLADRVGALNTAGVRLARDAAAGRAWVAGAVGPLGVRLAPDGPLDPSEAERVFRDQAEALLAAGVDLLMLETFRAVDELRLAVRVLRALTTQPVMAQMTTDATGRLQDGTTPETAASLLVDAGADAVGLNCSAGPVEMLEAVERLAAAVPVPIVAQPNAGLPREVEGRTLYLSSPDFVAAYARRFAAAGARLIGGCCGTTPDHIRQMAAALAGTLPRPLRAG